MGTPTLEPYNCPRCRGRGIRRADGTSWCQLCGGVPVPEYYVTAYLLIMHGNTHPTGIETRDLILMLKAQDKVQK